MARREIRLGWIPPFFGVVFVLYSAGIVGAVVLTQMLLATGSLHVALAGLVTPIVLLVTGLLVAVAAGLSLFHAQRLQPGTRGRARLTVMAISGLVNVLAYAVQSVFAVIVLATEPMPTFGGPISPEEVLLPLSDIALFGLYAAIAVFTLSYWISAFAAVSAWFLAPERFRFWFWAVTDGLLLTAFLPVAVLFPIVKGWLAWQEPVDVGSTVDVAVTHGIPPEVALELLAEPPLYEISVGLQAAALAITVLFTLRASIRLLPWLLDLIERLGFRPLVAARHLRAKKSGFLTVIGFFSIFAVMLSSCALTTTLSVMGGFRNDLKRKIIGNNAHVVVDVEEGGLDHWHEALATVRHTRGVRAASPYVSGEVMITSASNLAGAVLRGIDPERVSDVVDLRSNLTRGRLEYLSRPNMLLDLPPEEEGGPYPLEIPSLEVGSDGELPGPEPSGESPFDIDEILGEGPSPAVPAREVLPGIIVGQELARALRIYVGDEVNVVSPLGELGPSGPMPKSRPFRVAGIFYSGMYEYDMKYTYVMLDTAQRFLNTGNEISGIEIKTRDVERAPEVADAVRAALTDSGRGDLRVRDWQELNKTLFGALELERLAMFIFLGLAILVAGFCVFGTLTLMVQEKGPEVGILKAMGVREHHVVTIFVLEGLLIGVLGAALGLGLGYVACFAAEHFGLHMNPEVYYIDTLPVHIDPVEFGLVGLAAVVVCAVATIFPAVVASSARPVEALRYE